MGKLWKITLKNPDGTPFAVLLADAEEFSDNPLHAKESTGGNGNHKTEKTTDSPKRGIDVPAPKESVNGNGNDPSETITDPQKRYLFRLLAAQGIEGKAAEEHLKDRFRVSSLKDIPKLAASGYIDQLAKNRKEA
jgi:hypothetical protein